MDGIIAPEILHKGSADDVLIRSPGKTLPLCISAEQSEMLPAKTAACFGADGQGKFRFTLAAPSADAGENQPDAWQDNRGLPYQSLAAAAGVQSAESAALFKDRLSQVIEQQGAVFRPSTSLEMINTGDHYFFYRKMHEHVPGVMLIEAARQAVYYHLYTTTDHRCGQVTVSLSELNARFFTYAELMYPIELVVDDLHPPHPPRGRQLYYRVALYQRNVLLAIVDTKGTIINVDMFKKIRNAFLPEQDWFHPLKPAAVSCELTTVDGEKHAVSLLGVSIHGCITSLPEQLNPQQAIAVDISLENKLFFSAELMPVTYAANSPLWRFNALPAEQLNAIKEMVKRGFTHLRDEHMPVLQDAL